ncbi:competence/damage-inducible protein A [bacterium]|nr:competence/damage-inducible protein A [bacterium]
MIAEIISIGDELLNGITVNTNASFIGQQLTCAGIEVSWIETVGDDVDRLRDTLMHASKRVNIIIITGGLGPTHDDITKKVVADFFKQPLVFQPVIYQRLEAFFKSRGRTMSPLNRSQAEIPRGAEILENRLGTAPGFYLLKNRVHIFVLPGVPGEMQRMMQTSVLPKLKHIGLPGIHFLKTLHTIGISESSLNEAFITFKDMFPGVRLASLPNAQGVSLRLSMNASEKSGGKPIFKRAVEFTREAAGQYLYGEDEDTIESVVGNLLLKHNYSIAVAESCTGGLIGHRLTNISGSSQYFQCGVVTYSDWVKIDLLKVPESVIRKYGAVSKKTAIAMAKGVIHLSGADAGLSVTGIAGPTGGSKGKPVGLVYIGYIDKYHHTVEKFIFSQDRILNKMRFSGYALDLVRRMLQDST